tara:strand:+ start:6407 stop:6940 length:534 start_codon:yes stop_codon:yes gene_type:complete
MTILKILQYPDPKLKRVSIPVDDFGPDIQKVIDDMLETHYNAENCAALAATQLDLEPAWRITVIDYSENKDQPQCLVNPEIIESSGEQFEIEGCMSVYPDYAREKVKRAMKVKVHAQDRYGKPIEIEAEGFYAKCLQHEIDHLDGLTYVDRLPKIKKDRINKKVTKAKREIKNNRES